METSAANERENYWRELVASQQETIYRLTRLLAKAQKKSFGCPGWWSACHNVCMKNHPGDHHRRDNPKRRSP